MCRERAEDLRGVMFMLLSALGLVAWCFLLLSATARGGVVASGMSVEVLKLASVVVGGGLAALGCRGMSVEMSAMFRPLRDGIPTEDGVYRLVRFPIFGGLMIAFGAGFLVSLTLVVPSIYLALVWWRWSIWADALFDRSYSNYAAYHDRVHRRFIPLIW